MQRLTGLDAGFLYMETPSLHMHTLKIAILDPSTAGGYSFSRVKEELGRRLHLLPPFRRRLVEVPFQLHHPVWIEDPDFDLDWHVRRVVVPAPGGQRQLCEVISEIASSQLDRTRPLWEIHVVEGLDDGHIGFVAKIHHAVADGVAAAELLANVFTADPQSSDPMSSELPVPATEWRPDALPSRWRLLRDASLALLAGALRLPKLLGRTATGLRNVARVRRHHSERGAAPPQPFKTPKTFFNGALTPHRWFTVVDLPLDDVKAVKAAFGVTVNDVVLAMCAGALRRYLTDRGELPDRPLVAGVPIGLPPEDGQPRLSGNSVSNMFTSLCTDIEDPAARLMAIHEVTKAAKDVHKALGEGMLADWSELTPPRPFAAWMRFYSRRKLADRHRPPINLVVSNVPGPTAPLAIAGARLVAIWSMGPVLEGIGLNITVWSYLDRIAFGLVSCRETMPDLWTLTDALPDALAELKKAAAARS